MMKPAIIRGQVVRLICRSLAVAFLVALMGFASVAEAWDIPSDRRITWQGNVGVSGGIPNRTTEINCVTNYGVPVDGTTSSNAAIQSCLNGISSGQVAYLPAGTYTITGNITIPSNKTLRGAGMDSTIIRANTAFGSYTGNGLITMRGAYTDRSSATVVDITSMTKGSSDITLSSASAFSVGDHLFIDVLNGSWYNNPVNDDVGIFGQGATRAFATMHKVLAKNGNVLTIDPPVVNPPEMLNTPQAVKANAVTSLAGVENLTVKNDTGVTSATNNNNIFMQATSQCWVKNVKVERCGRYCMDIYHANYRPEIRDSWIRQCINRVPSDYCYGVHLWNTSFGLVENNIFESTADAAIVANSIGNVIAYNYGIDTGRYDTSGSYAGWYFGGDWSHALQSSLNLFEGQYMEGIMLDNIHGGNSYNTIYRSRYLGKKPNNDCSGGACYFAYAVALGRFSYWDNIVGNVLGTSGYSKKYDGAAFSSGAFNIYSTGYDNASGGDINVFATLLRHANYDYVTNSVKLCTDAGETGCQGGASDLKIPTSLYLSSKPSWWGSQPWPPIGPDVPGYATSIPARDRFNGAKPPATHTVMPSAGPNGSISPNTARTVNDGTTAQFTVTPNAGYTVAIGGTCGGTLSGATYTTNMVTADCTVTATFTLIPGGTQTRPSPPPVVIVQ